jgi:hypothetical protein
VWDCLRAPPAGQGPWRALFLTRSAPVWTRRREDFYEDDPRFDEKRLRALRAVAKDPNSSLMGRWRRETPFPALTEVCKQLHVPDPPRHAAVDAVLTRRRAAACCCLQAFAQNGLPEISGELFISRIAALCTSDGGKHTFGSWMDIVGRPKGSDHAWHQDSGLVQDTAMLGFPKENG